VGELAHAEEVDRGEERHQHDGGHDAARGQHVLAMAHLHPAAGERVVLAILDDGHDLDRGDRRGLQPREPPERGADRAAEGVVREARRAPGHGIHGAELGMDEREQQDRHRADDPGDDRRRPRGRERALRAEEPSGPDDRSARGPQEADEADLAPQPGARRRDWCDGFCDGHGPPMLRRAAQPTLNGGGTPCWGTGAIVC
jgi:hypothetical protein